LRELATPGLLAVMAPIAVGFGLGVGALGAYLAGAIGTGTLMAVFLSNSGGAWDNAKKINPLIKVMNLVGLLVTPAIVSFALGGNSNINTAIGVVATLIIVAALVRNRRQSTSIEY
jgi:K(+)-stimulated pyrophosphate-energized sodium pump